MSRFLFCTLFVHATDSSSGDLAMQIVSKLVMDAISDQGFCKPSVERAIQPQVDVRQQAMEGLLAWMSHRNMRLKAKEAAEQVF